MVVSSGVSSEVTEIICGRICCICEALKAACFQSEHWCQGERPTELIHLVGDIIRGQPTARPRGVLLAMPVGGEEKCGVGGEPKKAKPAPVEGLCLVTALEELCLAVGPGVEVMVVVSFGLNMVMQFWSRLKCENEIIFSFERTNTPDCQAMMFSTFGSNLQNFLLLSS
jgi:hypothetical protein